MLSSLKQSNQGIIDELLSVLNDILLDNSYSVIKHTRVSYFPDFNEGIIKNAHANTHFYEGLTRVNNGAQTMMLKWEFKETIKNEQSALASQFKLYQSIKADVLKLHEVTQLGSILNSESLTTSSADGYLPIIPITNFFQKLKISFSDKLWDLTIIQMPYMNGGNLNRYLKNNSFNKQDTYMLIISIANLISQLHQAGWLHGDLKPSNILVIKEDGKKASSSKSNVCDGNSKYRCYLSDLSYAAPLNFIKLKSIIKESKDHKTQTTDSKIGSCDKQSISGTPAYLAPECWRGNRISIKSDLYAFGIILYEIIVGKRPYEVSGNDANKMQMLAKFHCQSEIPLLPEEWQNLQPILDKLLAKKIENRFPNMDTVIEALINAFKV